MNSEHVLCSLIAFLLRPIHFSVVNNWNSWDRSFGSFWLIFNRIEKKNTSDQSTTVGKTSGHYQSRILQLNSFLQPTLLVFSQQIIDELNEKMIDFRKCFLYFERILNLKISNSKSDQNLKKECANKRKILSWCNCSLRPFSSMSYLRFFFHSILE